MVAQRGVISWNAKRLGASLVIFVLVGAVVGWGHELMPEEGSLDGHLVRGQLEKWMEKVVKADVGFYGPKEIGSTSKFSESIDVYCMGQCPLDESGELDIHGASKTREALFVSLLHAREPIGMETMAYWVGHLASQAIHGPKEAKEGDDDEKEVPEASLFLASRTVWFVYIANPDGYEENVIHDVTGKVSMHDKTLGDESVCDPPLDEGDWANEDMVAEAEKRREYVKALSGVNLDRAFSVEFQERDKPPKHPDEHHFWWECSELFNGADKWAADEAVALRDFIHARKFSTILHARALGNKVTVMEENNVPQSVVADLVAAAMGSGWSVEPKADDMKDGSFLAFADAEEKTSVALEVALSPVKEGCSPPEHANGIDSSDWLDGRRDASCFWSQTLDEDRLQGRGALTAALWALEALPFLSSIEADINHNEKRDCWKVSVSKLRIGNAGLGAIGNITLSLGIVVGEDKKVSSEAKEIQPLPNDSGEDEPWEDWEAEMRGLNDALLNGLTLEEVTATGAWSKSATLLPLLSTAMLEIDGDELEIGKQTSELEDIKLCTCGNVKNCDKGDDGTDESTIAARLAIIAQDVGQCVIYELSAASLPAPTPRRLHASHPACVQLLPQAPKPSASASPSASPSPSPSPTPNADPSASSTPSTVPASASQTPTPSASSVPSPSEDNTDSLVFLVLISGFLAVGYWVYRRYFSTPGQGFDRLEEGNDQEDRIHRGRSGRGRNERGGGGGGGGGGGEFRREVEMAPREGVTAAVRIGGALDDGDDDGWDFSVDMDDETAAATTTTTTIGGGRGGGGSGRLPAAAPPTSTAATTGTASSAPVASGWDDDFEPWDREDDDFGGSGGGDLADAAADLEAGGAGEAPKPSAGGKIMLSPVKFAPKKD